MLYQLSYFRVFFKTIRAGFLFRPALRFYQFISYLYDCLFFYNCTPVVGVFNFAVLDAGKGLVQLAALRSALL